MIHDAEKNTWSVVLPLSLQVKGQSERRSLSGSSGGDRGRRGVSSRRSPCDVVERGSAGFSRAVAAELMALGPWRGSCRLRTNDDARFLADRALARLWDRTGADRRPPIGCRCARARDVRRDHAGRGLGVWSRVLGVVSGLPSPVTRRRRLRRRYAFGVRFLTVLSLVVYGWIIHWVGWSKMVRTNWGLGGLVLVDDFVVFLPYLSIQLLVWWGLFFAERACRSVRARTRRAGSAGT